MIWFLLLLVSAVLLLYGVTLLGTLVINKRYPHTGRYIDVDGVRVHCVERGQPSPDRPSLVFVHGASSNHREFMIALGDLLASRFAKDQHVIFVDRPGQGGSDRRTGDHSPKVQAERICKVAAELGAPAIVAIGHSWGGAVVAQMAVHGGPFVQGAVFVAPATHPWPGDRFNEVDWHYAVSSMPVIGWLFTRLITLPVAWQMIDDGVETVFAPEPAKAGYAKALGARLVLRPRSFQANAEDVYFLRDFIIAQSPRYREITCPVHVLTGDADGVVWPHLHSEGLERDIAGARKVVISGGGHMPHQTHPELVLDGIEDVLVRAAEQTRVTAAAS